MCVFDVTLCHIITDNLLKLQHTPGNYPGTGCVLLPNPRKLCTVIQPRISTLPTPTPHLPPAWPRLAVSVVASLISSLAAEYENFVWANLLYGILIVFAQLKLDSGGAQRVESSKTRSGKLETKTEN